MEDQGVSVRCFAKFETILREKKWHGFSTIQITNLTFKSKFDMKIWISQNGTKLCVGLLWVSEHSNLEFSEILKYSVLKLRQTQRSRMANSSSRTDFKLRLVWLSCNFDWDVWVVLGSTLPIFSQIGRIQAEIWISFLSPVSQLLLLRSFDFKTKPDHVRIGSNFAWKTREYQCVVWQSLRPFWEKKNGTVSQQFKSQNSHSNPNSTWKYELGSIKIFWLFHSNF